MTWRDPPTATSTRAHGADSSVTLVVGNSSSIDVSASSTTARASSSVMHCQHRGEADGDGPAAPEPLGVSSRSGGGWGRTDARDLGSIREDGPVQRGERGGVHRVEVGPTGGVRGLQSLHDVGHHDSVADVRGLAHAGAVWSRCWVVDGVGGAAVRGGRSSRRAARASSTSLAPSSRGATTSTTSARRRSASARRRWSPRRVFARTRRATPNIHGRPRRPGSRRGGPRRRAGGRQCHVRSRPERCPVRSRTGRRRPLPRLYA